MCFEDPTIIWVDREGVERKIFAVSYGWGWHTHTHTHHASHIFGHTSRVPIYLILILYI